MKISRSQMFRNLSNWCFGTLFFVFFAGTFSVKAQDGAQLFKAKCNTCHMVDKNSTGPLLKGVKQKWIDAGEGELIYEWVKNPQSLVASGKSKVAQESKNFSPSDMTPQSVTNEELDAILDYIDTYEAPVVEGAAPGAGDATGATGEEESDNKWIWIILGIIFITVILAVGGVRRQLSYASAEASGEDVKDGMTYTEELRSWAWKNKKYVGFGALVFVISLVVVLFLGLYSIGVVENYQPSQPIAFPHSVHAGINGIDCKYCHSSVTKSKTAGIPSVNVCMNCHKQVNGRTPAQQEQIAKIYAAAGYNPEGAGKYTGKTKPIVWNKVHVLPDHVYFNHSQHVVVGGIDCKQCHGDMTKQVETQKVWPVAELNKIEGNIPLTKPTLTMGWCIECHAAKEVSTGSLDSKNSGYYNEIHKRLLNNDKSLYGKYLEDGKVTVSELGGWECAKCHY